MKQPSLTVGLEETLELLAIYLPEVHPITVVVGRINEDTVTGVLAGINATHVIVENDEIEAPIHIARSTIKTINHSPIPTVRLHEMVVA